MTNSEIKQKLFDQARSELRRDLTLEDTQNLWHNFTDTGDIETDVDDAITRTFVQNCCCGQWEDPESYGGMWDRSEDWCPVHGPEFAKGKQ